jgi:hypothetical protein
MADDWVDYKPPQSTQGWVDYEPKQRGVLERAGSAIAETARAGWEAAKRPFTETGEEQPTPMEALKRALPSARAPEFAVSPLTMTAGALTSGAQSLLASGEAAAARLAGKAAGAKNVPTSEEAYQALYPEVGKALMAAGVKGRSVPAATPEAVAGRVIEQAATDPAALKKTLETPPPEIVPGSEPTTYQLTNDPGLGKLERGAMTRNNVPFQQRLQEQNDARMQALREVQQTGNPQAVSDHLRDTMRAENTMAERDLKLAQQRAFEASEQVGGTYDPTTYGNIMRQGLRDAEGVTRAYERHLWDQVDPDGGLVANPQGVQDLERDIYGRMPEGGAAEASLTPAERQITEVIQNYAPQGIPFQEMRALRSLVSTQLRQELLANGQSPAYGRLSRLRGGIEDAIIDSVPLDVVERLRAASAATAQRAQTFRAEGVKGALQREGAQGAYKVGEASVPGQFIKGGPKGYDVASNYLRAVGAPGLEDFQDAVAASMRREVIGPDGAIKPGKLRSWLTKYQDTLRAIDERDGGAFSQNLRDVGRAQDVLAQAEERQAAIAERYGKGQLGKLVGAVDDEDISRQLGTIIGQGTGPSRALASQLTTPEAQAGAQQAIVDFIRRRFVSNAPAGDDPLLRADQFQTFVKNSREALLQFMTPQQVSSLQAIARDLQQMNRSVQTKIRGGSNTAQDLATLQQQRELISGAAALVIDSTLHMTGVPVPVAHGVKFARKFMGARAAAKQEARAGQIQKLVDQATLDPALANRLLQAAQETTARLPRGTLYGIGVEESQRTSRKTGGHVHAASFTRGRPLGEKAFIAVRKARERTGKTLSDGRAQRFQQAGAVKPKSHERFAGMLTGSPSAGGIFPSRGDQAKPKVPTPPTETDIARQLRSQGVTGEQAGGFAGQEWGPKVEQYQEGGAVNDINPWLSQSVQESRQRDPGYAGPIDPRSKAILGRRTGDENVIERLGSPAWKALQQQRLQEGGEINADSRSDPPEIASAAKVAAANRAAQEAGAPPSEYARQLDYLRRQGANAFVAPEEYDPRPVLGATLGAVGAPAVGLTREAATLGAGAIRRGAATAVARELGSSLTPAERAAPLEAAPYSQYAEEYPPIGAGTPTPKTKPSYEGETFLKKTLTPESKEFEKARTKIMADMKENGYTPYFDPGERFLVDPNHYPAANVDTLQISPKRQDAIDKYMEQIGAPQTRALLRQAFQRGQQLGNAHDWYFMGQLEKEFTNELGPEAGREAFLQRFAVPMAATTSGNQPTANMLIAHYLEFLRNHGRPMPTGAWETPPSVGGRFFMNNVEDYQNIMGGGGYQALGAGQPKMHNFARSFVGDLSRAVMDEQMAGGMLAHAGKKSLADPARKIAYGLLEKPVHQEAARAGVQPGAFQDVAWAGFKNEPGKPMIEHVNDAIERTHRLTGMPRDEIVSRALIRGEIPLYTTGAVPLPNLQQGQ